MTGAFTNFSRGFVTDKIGKMQRNWSHPTEQRRNMDQMRTFQFRQPFDDPRSFYKPMVPNEGMEHLLEELLETQGRAMGELIKKMDDLYLNFEGKINILRRDVERLYAKVEDLEQLEESRWSRRPRESLRTISTQKIQGRIVQNDSSEENSSDFSDTVDRLEAVDRPHHPTVDRPSQVGRPRTSVDRPEPPVDRLPCKNRVMEDTFVPTKISDSALDAIAQIKEENEKACPMMKEPPQKKKNKINHHSVFSWVDLDARYIKTFLEKNSKLTAHDFNLSVNFHIEDLLMEMPFIEGCRLEGELRRVVKACMDGSLHIDAAISILATRIDREIAYRMPEKSHDPGKLGLDIHIGKSYFQNCLCDTGASVNIIPREDISYLGPVNVLPCDDVVRIADGSVVTPKGKLKNLPVNIGDRFIPTDFYILEIPTYDEYGESGLVLGRPFLKTAGAIIDYTNDTITLTKVGTPAPTLKMHKPRYHSDDEDIVRRVAVVTRCRRRRNTSSEDDPDYTVDQTVGRPVGRPPATSRPTTPLVGRPSATSRPTTHSVGRLPSLKNRETRFLPSFETGSIQMRSTNIWVRPEHVEYRLPGPTKSPIKEIQLDNEIEVLCKEIIEVWPFIQQCGVEVELWKYVADLYTGDLKLDAFCSCIANLCDDRIKDLVPRKFDDPGRPTINCMIGYTWFEDVLCDTGAGANIMPLSVAHQLGFTWLTNRTMSIRLADDSHKDTEGVLENVPVRAAGRFYAVDFHVIRYEGDPPHLLILGRPFLRTANITINCTTTEVTFGDQASHFGRRPPGFQRTLPRGMFRVPHKGPPPGFSRTPRMSVRPMPNLEFARKVVKVESSDEEMGEQHALHQPE